MPRPPAPELEPAPEVKATPELKPAPAARQEAPELKTASAPLPEATASLARAPAPAAGPEAAAFNTPVAARTEQSQIQQTLGQYRSAYQRLDAGAARAVWPSVDARALARAFDSLTSQELAFDSCSFEIAGGAATAICTGSASYTPKIGNREPRLESRQWTFQLRKDGEGWKIERAQTRR